MGMMKFLLPSPMSADAVYALERSSVAGGQDNMPYPTQVILEQGQMTVVRAVDESGSLVTPWQVNGSGRVMIGSATLMERANPYQLLIELARGKLNQVRGQTADWVMGGLEMTDSLMDKVRQATQAFVKAVVKGQSDDAAEEAQNALAEGCKAAEFLAQTYMKQVFHLRHQRQPHLDSAFGCRLTGGPADDTTWALLEKTFNAVGLPFSWDQIEPEEGKYQWGQADAHLDWATARGMRLHAGPLIDFSGAHFPDWFWKRKRDLGSLAAILCDYVATVVARYRTKIRTWQITAASNAFQALAMGDEELLWLTVRLVEAARQVDQGLEIVLGISQPWGEYLVTQERTHSPFLFADTLVRSGLKLAGLDLELVMGVTPRGSYCRDLLEVSRILDLYGLLGVPMQVTLGYPSAHSPDPLADPELTLAGGHWHDGFTPEAQAGWAATYAGLALCKPSVRAVHWIHDRDSQAHQFPHCGLVDAQGKEKPALHRLRELREAHLK